MEGENTLGLMVVPSKPTQKGLELHTLRDALSGMMMKNSEVCVWTKAMESKGFVDQNKDVGIINLFTARTISCLMRFFSSVSIQVCQIHLFMSLFSCLLR